MAESPGNVYELPRRRGGPSRDGEQRPPLNGDGGDGTSGGMTDDWKSDVDRQLAQLHSDVRNLLYGLIGAFLILAGGGWMVYDRLSEQATVARIDQARTEGKIDLLGQKLDQIVGAENNRGDASRRP